MAQLTHMHTVDKRAHALLAVHFDARAGQQLSDDTFSDRFKGSWVFHGGAELPANVTLDRPMSASRRRDVCIAYADCYSNGAIHAIQLPTGARGADIASIADTLANELHPDDASDLRFNREWLIPAGTRLVRVDTRRRAGRIIHVYRS